MVIGAEKIARADGSVRRSRRHTSEAFGRSPRRARPCGPSQRRWLGLRRRPLGNAMPIPLIVDTDLSTDVDDAGALCVAHALADRGEATLLAILHNSGLAAGVGAISAINHYYRRDDFVDPLVAEFPGPVTNSSQVPSALRVYREALKAADDHSVSLVSMGFLTNLLALLRSPPDATSPLSGLELVQRKVRKLTVMGGRFPSIPEG